MTNGGFVDVWGYLATEKFKSAAWMLEHLCKLRAWGGNLLINIGPGPDGDLPQSAYERLSEVADWMAHSKESVIGADGEPEPNPANVPMTVRGRSRYLHLIPGSGGAIRVDSSIPAPASARLLRTGGSLSIVQDSAGFTIVVPDDLRTGLVDVVVIE
jgi:alpha-L-fucosidase